MDAKDDTNIVGFTKPFKFLFFKIKSKPIYAKGAPNAPMQPSVAAAQQAPAGQYPNAGSQPYLGAQVPTQQPPQVQPATPQASQQAARTESRQEQGKVTKFQLYVDKIVAKQKNLDITLRDQGIKGGPEKFVKKMITNAIILAIVIGAITVIIFDQILAIRVSNPIPIALVLGAVIAYGAYNALFRQFLGYPFAKAKSEGKEIERGILFAARDMIISLRSGVPLFNAMTAVSTGYGAASKEFVKIISLIQLGMPMDQAMEEISSVSSSRTFKRIMLQASVSIKEGADIVQALQEVVDQVMQERVIELRRYGQRLNALSMFYMLFGIIFPSMGVAVLTILTTFVNVFTVTTSFLIFVLIFIAILQFIFIMVMKNSRPIFSM
jgi:flagellar protein FlaJ